MDRTQLILSLFPGIDLLGKGFEAEGFCVVRGPDKLWGGDIREFHPIAGRFDGIIGGPPCQDFSGMNRNPGNYGFAMLDEYIRVVGEAKPDWWLMENVARVPDIAINGYQVQRFDLNARECGLRQSRLRHFQFGSQRGLVLVPQRIKLILGPVETICLASEGLTPNRRDFADFCELQGLPRDFDLDLSTGAKYKAVGNGVPIPMARVIARAIRAAEIGIGDVRLCLCGCGRIVAGHKIMATDGCRKRMERRRKRDCARLLISSTVTVLA